MKFAKLMACLLCSTIMFCACTKNSDVVLRINDEAITKEEFYSDFNKIKKIQLKNSPKEVMAENSYPSLVLKERYTNDVIIRKLLGQEFDKRKIEATPAEIEEKKNTIIKQIGSVEQLQQMLKENDISQERFTKDMASEVKVEKLINELGGSKISDKEVQAYYNNNKDRFTMPERVQASHILIDTNPENIKRQIVDADKDAKLSSSDIDKKVAEEIKRKEALIKEIKAKATPKNFSQLAKEYSEDKGTKDKGGDLGYFSKGEMVPEFEKAAFSQKIGAVGSIVKSNYGEHIILVKDKAAKGIQPFATIKDDLAKFLLSQKKSETIQKFIEGIKAQAKIEYLDPSLNPETLKKQAEEALQKELEKQKKEEAKKAKLEGNKETLKENKDNQEKK